MLSTAVVLGISLSVAVAGVAVFYVYHNFEAWVDRHLDATFHNVDIDNSGTIERAELYAAVLEFYCEINLYLSVRPPKRETVIEMAEVLDTDEAGMKIDEFKRFMRVISQQILGRALTQVTVSFLTLEGLVKLDLELITADAKRENTRGS
eukprot:scaffold462_cov195-Pinguiococcus_pyrenoidosus.AAC.28